MASWLTVTLKWGGIAVAIVFAAALIWVDSRRLTPRGRHRRPRWRSTGFCLRSE